MLEFLFNIAPRQFAGAHLELALPPGWLALIALAGVALALAAGGYLRRPRRTALMALRAGLALLAVVALARPVLRVPAPDAAGVSVAVLLDDSMSMGIADAPAGERRGDLAVREFAPGSGALARELEERFEVRYLGFGATLAAAPAALAFGSPVSDPLGALLDATAGGALAGVVLVSDGGQVSSRDLDDAITRLRAAGVPVHVVGVGAPHPAPDVAVAGVTAPARALRGDTLDLQVHVTGRGAGPGALTVNVRDAGVLVGSAALELPAGAGGADLTIPVRLEEPGFRHLEVRVDAPAGDRIAGNDARDVLVHVREQPSRVLHFEGEPRFEVKFVRRALAGDPSLSLASLVRTGDNRFLRLGVRDPDELAEGFPRDAQALFRYEVLVLGSVEAAAFSASQLELLEAFVARRGGSLLLLGGRNALAEGGFAATPVADLAPVFLEAPAAQFRTAATALITRDGGAHPMLRGLLRGPYRDGAPLPALAVVNPVRRAKPGASVLLQGDDGSAEPLVLLAWHRYGRGQVAVLAARDTWRWRMHADMPPEDRTHELFWRRLLRWLARDVPGPVTAGAGTILAAPGQSVQVDAQVLDAAFEPAPGAQPQLVVTTPLGDIERRVMAWRAGDASRFGAAIAADATGLHTLSVETPPQGGMAGATGQAAFLVTADGEEFHHAGLGEELLERIAARTGGSYRHIDAAAGLGTRVAQSIPPVEVLRRVALWNAPVLLLAMLALACGEWWLRRRRRLT